MYVCFYDFNTGRSKGAKGQSQSSICKEKYDLKYFTGLNITLRPFGFAYIHKYNIMFLLFLFFLATEVSKQKPKPVLTKRGKIKE